MIFLVKKYVNAEKLSEKWRKILEFQFYIWFRFLFLKSLNLEKLACCIRCNINVREMESFDL